MRTSILVLTLACGSVLAVVAQQPPAAAPDRAEQQPPITFRVEVNYVEIDASVTDARGNFVRDLTRADFQIFEDGKAQSVSVFSLVDIPVERPDPPLFATAPIEPDIRTNHRAFDGRVFVIVLDDLHTSFARSPRVRLAARQFIERYLGANDVAAIVQTGGSGRSAQEFTSSRARLLKAVEGFAGQAARSATLEALDERVRNAGLDQQPGSTLTGSEAERAFKARNALGTLKNVAEYMAGVRGRRKSVVLFSEGIEYDISNPIANRYASDIQAEIREAIAAATRANVSFYAIDPRGLGGLEDAIEMQSLPEDNSITMASLWSGVRIAQDSLRMLADETGGFAAVNRNDFRESFARVIQDNSSYYVLGYYPSDARRDGRFRRVEVRVARPGLQVRARKGYVAPTGRRAADKPVNPSTSPELREALDSPIPVSGLGVSVFAAALKGSAPNASVALTLEVEGSRLRFENQNGTFATDLEVAVLAVDDRGKIRDGGRDIAELRLRPQNHEVVARQGVRITRRLELPPGRYHLRVGVRDAGSGAVGSVLHDIDVPDFSRSRLEMSGLLLTSAAARRVPTANPDPEFKDVLPGPPAAARDFPQGDILAVFAEVYDNDLKTPHRVAIRAQVIADDGNVVFSAADERRSDELKGSAGGYGYTASIPLAQLAPGRYVLRVEAQTLLAGGPTTAREVEFRVR